MVAEKHRLCSCILASFSPAKAASPKPKVVRAEPCLGRRALGEWPSVWARPSSNLYQHATMKPPVLSPYAALRQVCRPLLTSHSTSEWPRKSPQWPPRGKGWPCDRTLESRTILSLTWYVGLLVPVKWGFFDGLPHVWGQPRSIRTALADARKWRVCTADKCSAR